MHTLSQISLLEKQENIFNSNNTQTISKETTINIRQLCRAGATTIYRTTSSTLRLVDYYRWPHGLSPILCGKRTNKCCCLCMSLFLNVLQLLHYNLRQQFITRGSRTPGVRNAIWRVRFVYSWSCCFQNNQDLWKLASAITQKSIIQPNYSS